MSGSIRVCEFDDVAVMVCSGHITLGAPASEFRNTFRGLIQRGVKKLVIDFGEVSYLDSTGIGELVGAFTNAYNAQAVVKLASLPEKIRNLLEITRLVTVFEICRDQAEAIRSFRS